MLINNIQVLSGGTQITAQLKIAANAIVGDHLVVVSTPNGPSQSSIGSGRIFTVNQSASSGSVPIVKSVNPGGAAIGGGAVNVTINGENLTGASSVQLLVPTPGAPTIDSFITTGS